MSNPDGEMCLYLTCRFPTRSLAVVAVLALVPACYSSYPSPLMFDASAPDMTRDAARDSHPDLASDPAPDPLVDPGRDAVPDPIPDSHTDALPDGRTGWLEPEGPEETYGSESGMDVAVHSGWLIPAAFSGSVYEIIMDEDVPWATDDSFTAVYRLAPGGAHLGTSWIDTDIDATSWGTICWSGEVFIAVLPTPGVGIQLIAVNEGGVLMRPVEILGADPAYAPGAFSGAPIVLCPSTGPFVIDRFGGDKIYQLNRDGSPSGGVLRVEVPGFGMNVWGVPCTEAGAEAVCATSSGIVFVSRDGSYRHSDPVPPGFAPCYDTCDVAFTGAYVALLFSSISSDKLYATYTLFAMDGSLLVPPATGHPVGTGPRGFHAASSGDTVLLVAEGSGGPGMDIPHAHLFDLLGSSMGEPVPITEGGVPASSSRGMAVFWEHDAYTTLWNPWPFEVVAYRRFLIVD